MYTYFAIQTTGKIFSFLSKDDVLVFQMGIDCLKNVTQLLTSHDIKPKVLRQITRSNEMFFKLIEATEDIGMDPQKLKAELHFTENMYSKYKYQKDLFRHIYNFLVTLNGELVL